MIGKYKKFDKELFNDNDPKCRKVVKDYLAKYNIFVNDNPNKYGVDLLSEDESVQLELERRTGWIKEEFPFKEVNIPERKAKFFTNGKVSYVVISNDYSHIGIITPKKVQKYIDKKYLKESSNRFIQSGELFYKIPKSEFKWVKIDN